MCLLVVKNTFCRCHIYVTTIVKFSNGSIQNLFNVDKWTCMDSHKLTCNLYDMLVTVKQFVHGDSSNLVVSILFSNFKINLEQKSASGINEISRKFSSNLIVAQFFQCLKQLMANPFQRAFLMASLILLKYLWMKKYT